MPRDENPIFVIPKEENRLRVTDGNRRLLRAILQKQKNISAVIGTPIAQPPIYESWIPTSTLIDLVSLHRYWTALGRDVTASISRIITELIRDSASGRFEFTHRSLSKTVEADAMLLDSVQQELAAHGIDLSLKDEEI
jgi:predicted HTH domain antitoxin